MSKQDITKIPASRVPLTEGNSPIISREWYRFFNNLFILLGGGDNSTSITTIKEEVDALQAETQTLQEEIDAINEGIGNLGTMASQNADDVKITGGSATNLFNLESRRLIVNGAATAASLTLTTPLAATDGGTGFDTYTAGQLLYALNSTSLTKLNYVSRGTLYASGFSQLSWRTPCFGRLRYYGNQKSYLNDFPYRVRFNFEPDPLPEFSADVYIPYTSCNCEGSISGTTLTVTSIDPGQTLITLGALVSDGPGTTNVLSETTIVEFLSGAGGTGTYRVDKSQTVASQDLWINQFSKIKPAAGFYLVNFNANLLGVAGGDTTVGFCFAKNSTTEIMTTKWLTVPKNHFETISMSYLFQMDGDDYIEVYWTSEDPDLVIYANENLFTPMPAGAGAILTINKIAEYYAAL